MEFITVATIVLASMNVSNHDYGFAYNAKVSGNAVTTQVVYQKSEDGHSLSRHLKYNYTYDEQQRLTKKEVLKWNAGSEKWENSYCLNYAYDVLGYSIEYVWWNGTKSGYTDAVAKQVYDESMDGALTLTLYKWNKADKDWAMQTNSVMMNPGERLLSSYELEL